MRPRTITEALLKYLDGGGNPVCQIQLGPIGFLMGRGGANKSLAANVPAACRSGKVRFGDPMVDFGNSQQDTQRKDTMKREYRRWETVKRRTACLTIMAFWAVVCLLLMPLASGSAFGQDGPVSTVPGPDDAAAQAQTTLQYWTPDRMEQATPMPLIKAVPQGEAAAERALPADEAPRYTPGWKPGSGPQPDPRTAYEVTTGSPPYDQLIGYTDPQTYPPFSPPSSPTDYINYAPFERWTWYGFYLAYPTSTIGKLFFTQNGSNYVCSASVIARNTIATAGHCVSDGAGNFSYNFLFCPSYYKGSGSGAPYPTLGCWAWDYATVSSHYHYGGSPDYDYACVVTEPSNSTTGKPIGNMTGWTGIGYNFASRLSTFAWGYPSAYPFPGYHIITSASTEWYQIDMATADSQQSKYIGSDQTGGASGGPWWFGMTHKTAEYPDTDGSNITDPYTTGGPYLNGVNSHKRCTQAGCPAGSVFTQEMGSPQFTYTDSDGAKSVFDRCFNNGGS